MPPYLPQIGTNYYNRWAENCQAIFLIFFFFFCGLVFSTPLCLDRVHRTAVCGIQYPEEPFLRRLGEHRGHPPNDLKHLRYGGGAHTAADAALIINRYCHIAASFSHEYYNGNLPFLQQLSAVKGCGLTGISHRFCNTFFIYFILHLCYGYYVDHPVRGFPDLYR